MDTTTPKLHVIINDNEMRVKIIDDDQTIINDT